MTIYPRSLLHVVRDWAAGLLIGAAAYVGAAQEIDEEVDE